MRLDIALTERGLAETREKAARAIRAGQVRVNDQRATKPSDRVRPADRLEILEPEPFVSRGGYKLDHALEVFGAPPPGFAAVDVGASTGGFTDCLLQRGARLVYAVDVGQGQLAWKLRQDSRVVVMEKTNARTLTPQSFPAPFEPVDLAVADCSFISLRHILPPLVPLVRPGAKLIVLVKPQFEAGKAEADKGRGVITDAAIHRRVLEELQAFVAALPGLGWRQAIPSPILGPAGNTEFLALIEKTH